MSGSKVGVLRYVGATDFAPGDWAGVELDEPHGKNDGAVAGKRLVLYGICMMFYFSDITAHLVLIFQVLMLYVNCTFV